MKRYPVVGIAGKARTGKDTIAALLLELGTASYRYAFADPIRAMLQAGLRIDMDADDWQVRKERTVAWLGVTPRRLMQTLGTEWGRQLINPDIWVNEAQLQWMERGPGMAISDVRFDNEADWIRRIGGKIVHVRRHAAPLAEAHSSEDGITVAPADILLDNSGTVAELRARLIELFIRPAS